MTLISYFTKSFFMSRGFHSLDSFHFHIQSIFLTLEERICNQYFTSQLNDLLMSIFDITFLLCLRLCIYSNSITRKISGDDAIKTESCNIIPLPMSRINCSSICHIFAYQGWGAIILGVSICYHGSIAHVTSHYMAI